MNLLTEEQRKLIANAKESFKNYAGLPVLYFEQVLAIIDLQGKALDKAVEQRDEFAESYYGACEAPEPYDNTYANGQLQKIMNGAGDGKI